ncbi:DUF6580 family putative transport protein [Bythopirellula polymerisocia]|uniref:Uncharacterized protein n=1 Tax=Bythopirellula polymerisocia TaxID=2528003 RepID=A0A5C6CZI6_9BACT|nr:DUF6580 family putative transport protein [Bythopirellula polymerisocia]TWU30052.1 hypothetical protein Pla144_08380 [Bythopirellula polymerisocia]
MNNRETLRELSVFGLLLAIGVAGRWAQPDWNFTPLAAVTVIGGYYFRSLLAAILLPVGILAVSDIILPAHESVAVQVSVHMMMLVPLFLGRMARHADGWQRVGLGVLGGVLPATAFFVVTNFVHWASTGMYEKSIAGLTACYIAALPFYRSMLAGDVFYLVVLVACLMIASARVPQRVRVQA